MPLDADTLDLSAIRETDSALILTLPVKRKARKINTPNNGFLALLAIAGFVGLLLMTRDRYQFGEILAVVVAGKFLYNGLYVSMGEDILEISQEYITIRYGIGFLKQKREYSAGWVKQLRCANTQYQQPTGPFAFLSKEMIHPMETLTDAETYAILCDYDGKTISLMGWIDKPLAKYFVSRIRDRFPIYP